MDDTWIGKTIGHYQIVEHLGRGGMAEVYKAYQPSLDRYVAIKILHPFVADDETFLARFEREPWPHSGTPILSVFSILATRTIPITWSWNL